MATDGRTENVDEAAAAYWRAVAAMTQPPEHSPERGPANEITVGGPVTDSLIEPGPAISAQAASASSTSQRPRRRL